MFKFLKTLVVSTLSLSLISVPAVAQIDNAARGLATQSIQQFQQLSNFRPMSIEERCLREGRPFGPGVRIENAAVTPGTGNSLLVASANLSPGYMAWVESISGSVYPRSDGATQPTNPIHWQILQGADAGNRFPQIVLAGILPPTGGSVGPFVQRQVLRPITSNTASFGLAVRNNGSAGNVSFGAGLSLTGCLLTDDMNWSAPRIMMVVGDSTCAGSSGATSMGMWEFKARDYVRTALGKDIRIVLKCLSGTQSNDHAGFDQMGWYDLGPTVAISMWRLGINDAAQGLTPATVAANMVAYYNKRRKLNPTEDIWFFGPTPLLTPAYESNAAAIRAGMQAQVATLQASDGKVHYCNLGTAWTATDATKTSDGTHYPSDTTEALVWNVVKTCFEASGGININ
jgi:hypothetical protein